MVPNIRVLENFFLLRVITIKYVYTRYLITKLTCSTPHQSLGTMRALFFLTLILLRASSAVDIIVVGGGISGLAAARALVDESCVAKFSVKVLEAESHIGGRT